MQFNKEYKDRLFRHLFGREEKKENIISLYNAINNTTYTDPSDFEITTLQDAIYIKMKNDVSLLVDSNLVLWEQQSSYNPNMPLRGLMYFGELYNGYISRKHINIYGETLVNIPTPQYIVFYNGTKEQESVRKLRLSDAFACKTDSRDFEWTAIMYNLNRGKNDELLQKCKPLADYMKFINYIRDYQNAGYSIEEAIDLAVQRCIEEDILKEYLLKHRAEVKAMVITEFNEEVFRNGIKEEGRAEGKIEELISLVKDKLLELDVAAQRCNMSVEDFSKLLKSNNP